MKISDCCVTCIDYRCTFDGSNYFQLETPAAWCDVTSASQLGGRRAAGASSANSFLCTSYFTAVWPLHSSRGDALLNLSIGCFILSPYISIRSFSLDDVGGRERDACGPRELEEPRHEVL